MVKFLFVHFYQKNALIQTKPVLEKAVIEVCMDLLHPTMIVVDLGCSSGENTLIFVSNVIEAICSNHDKLRGNLVELQVFLNDLPGNDFNRVFQSLEQFKESITITHKLEALPPFYIAGLPGSFYTKLFPRHSVHLFHSSYCLHWRSEVLNWQATVYLSIIIVNHQGPTTIVCIM